MNMRGRRYLWGFVSSLLTVALAAVSAQAGSLEPSAAPGPTMKTLDQIPPTWDQQLPVTDRFKLVMGGEAVLDKETGLVWQLSPSTDFFNWPDAAALCATVYSGGDRFGWRLPTLQEAGSLLTVLGSGGYGLPAGHPFNVLTTDPQDAYWTTTDRAPGGTSRVTPGAWTVFFGNSTDPFDSSDKSDTTMHAWCVRGGSGPAAQ